MDKIIFTLLIIISAGIGFFVGKNNNSVGINSSVPILVEYDQTKTPIIAKDALTKPENNFHQADVDASVDIQKSSNSSSPEAINQSAQQKIDAIKADYELKQRSEKFTDWLIKNQKEKAWFDLGMEMRGRFEAEDRDYNWASAEEGSLLSLFAQEPALAGIALKSTTCKSTQCQITISVMDQDHANETAMTITKVLNSENFSQIVIDSQVQQGESILYVSRSEKGFEFN